MIALEWFIDFSKTRILNKNVLEKEVLAKKDVLLESYYVASEIEGEVFVKIKQLRTPMKTYVDAHVLPNTILIRLVKVLEEIDHEKTKEIVYLGELKTPGKIPHHHHEHGYLGRTIVIEWFDEMLKKLSVSVVERNSYFEKARRNLERIIKAQEHAKELSCEILVAIEGESENAFGTSITRIVGIYTESSGNSYVCFIEEHARENMVTHYFFKMGKVSIK